MRVMVVARSKAGLYAPFVTEQVNALKQAGIDLCLFPVSESGIWGYLSHLPKLQHAIKKWRPDLIHAHYGLCGVLANMQRRIPVVTTYHGSDINDTRVYRLSRLALRYSSFNIFVSKKNALTAQPVKHYDVIPCGINLKDYPIVDKLKARDELGLNQDQKYVLFAGAFDNEVKNYPLAFDSMALLPDAKLLELKGYTRSQVATLMQAVDVLLMTSHTEGSPQVIKEALACGCPIVSVDVGDVPEQIEGIEGCFIAERDPKSISCSLKKALSIGHQTSGRSRIIENGLTNDSIARRIIEVYHSIE